MRVFLGFLKIQSRNQTCFQATSQFLLVFFRTDFTSLKDSCVLLGGFFVFFGSGLVFTLLTLSIVCCMVPAPS